MNKLFFELIKVAIDNTKCLSRTPTVDEWGKLFAMSMKQSLVGICFAGVQKLQAQQQCPQEELYLEWMGMATEILLQNEIVNKQCAELQVKLSNCGFKSCVLKGQGAAQLYSEPIRVLRQSGDIDVWVDGDRDTVLDAIRGIGVKVSSVDSVHAHAKFFSDTEVEVHSRPSWMYNRRGDNVFMEFWQKCKDIQFSHFDEAIGFAFPTIAFNLVYSMLHINRHIFEEGIGLRQLMDYYFVLKASTLDERKNAIDVLKKMGLARFVSGIMYIEHEVFGLPDDRMICKADQKEGEFLLDDIVKGGNFGKYNERTKVYAENERWKRGWFTIKHNVKYLFHYPCETLAIPFWKIGHYLWRKKKGYI